MAPAALRAAVCSPFGWSNEVCGWCKVYYAKGDPWDAHIDIQAHRQCAMDSDRPFAAVSKDLKSRGLLEDTLVVCGSEFGRTPVVETWGNGIQNGRDHNPFAFAMWMAGGGVKGGLIQAPPMISASR